MHWIIANEPNLAVDCDDYKGYGYTNDSDTDATFIVSYLKDFSRAMKNACADTACTNIRLIGPEITGFSNDTVPKTWDLLRDIIDDNELMDTITSGPATGKFLIDAISIHPYSRCTTRADVIDNPAVYVKSFKNKLSSNVDKYRGIAEIISTYSSRVDSNLKIACTEFNLSYNDTNEIETTDTGYANMIKGIGYRSYLASQWMAEVYSEAMKSGRVRYLAPWSVKERGSETKNPQNPCKEGKGFFSECDSSVAGPNHTRPIYWGYKMVASNFAETYLPQKNTTNDSVYKAFAYKNTATNPDEIGVIVINQNLQSPRGTDASTKSFKIHFNNTLPSGSDTMKFYFDASLDDSVTCTITNETTMLMVFNATNGDLLRKEVYSLGHALRKPDTGPEVWGISSSLNISNQNDFDKYYDAVYQDINISPSSAIIESSGDNKIIRFSNSVTIGGGSADFTVPADADFTLLPTEDCPE